MGDIAATYGRDPDGNVIERQEVLNPQHSTHITNLPGYRELPGPIWWSTAATRPSSIHEPR